MQADKQDEKVLENKEMENQTVLWSPRSYQHKFSTGQALTVAKLKNNTISHRIIG